MYYYKLFSVKFSHVWYFILLYILVEICFGFVMNLISVEFIFIAFIQTLL